jgi:hypothetical protein
MMWTILAVHAPILPLYLDPGTGSFLIQLLAGVLVGGLLAVKIYWRKLVSFFKKETPAPEDTDSFEDENPSNTIQ